jgi:hypothetical protein
VQKSFKTTVAKPLQICGTGSSQCTLSDVVIQSISNRRADLSVQFYVKAGSSSAAKTGATSLNTFLTTSGNTGFAAKLKAQATSDGQTSFANAVTTIAVTKAPTAKTIKAPTPAVGAASTTTTMSIASLACVALAMW